MSKRDKQAAVISIAITLALLGGVIAFVVNFIQKDRESPAVAQAFLQAVAEEKEEDAWRLMHPGRMSKKDFQAYFEDLCRYWKEQGGEKTFTMRRTGFFIQHYSGGAATHETRYSVESGEVRFQMIVTRVQADRRSGITEVQLF